MAQLKGRPTFAFNRSYIAWDAWGFNPTHYCAIDLRVLRSICAGVNTLIERDACESYHFHDSELDGFKTKRHIVQTEAVSFYTLRSGWGFDPDRPFYCGDVAAFSLQIAYRLGYRRASVVGVDLRWPERENVAARGWEHVALTGADNQHFHPDYYPAGMAYSDPCPDAHFASWQRSVQDAAAYGFEIVSCSPGSRLNEIVEYVPFEGAL